MRKILLNIVLGVCFLMAVSCGKNTVYQGRHSFDNNIWERLSEEKTVNFENIEIKDTSKIYDIYVSLRHTPYINENPIEFVLHIKSPSGIDRQSVHKVELMDRFKNKWIGDAMGDMIDVEQKVRSFVNFHEKGKYTITITNMGKYKQTVGIMDLGIKIKKANLSDYKNIK